MVHQRKVYLVPVPEVKDFDPFPFLTGKQRIFGDGSARVLGRSEATWAEGPVPGDGQPQPCPLPVGNHGA